jgi:hypothetical protein
MKCAVVKRRRHRRGTRLNEGTEPMGGFMPFGGLEAGRIERECAALARVKANVSTLTTHHGKLAAKAACAVRVNRVALDNGATKRGGCSTGKRSAGGRLAAACGFTCAEAQRKTHDRAVQACKTACKSFQISGVISVQ